MSQNKRPRKIFRPKKDEVTYNDLGCYVELRGFYNSYCVRTVKYRRLPWAGLVARMGKARNLYRIFWRG